MTDRRDFLVATGAVAALAFLPGRAQPIGAGRPPVAKRVPVLDDYYGTTVADPYRWMEDAKDPDLSPWLRAQDAYAREMLARLPGAAKLRVRVSELSGDLSVTNKVDFGGGRLFFEQRPAGAQSFKLFVREANGSVRTLVDPTTLIVDGTHISLDWWETSPSGRHVAYGLSRAGSEASTMHVIDVDTGRILDERIPDTDWGVTGWLPDSSGFLYIQLTGERGTPTLYVDSVVKLHVLGDEPAADRALLKRGLHEHVPMTPLQFAIIRPILGSDHAVVMVRDVRPERAVWTVRLPDLIAGNPRFKRVAGVEDLVVGVAATGDDLYVVSNRDAPRGRVLKTSVAAANLATAAEVLPQSRLVAEAIHPVAGGALVQLMDGGVQRLTRVTREGRVSAVALPFEGSVTGVFSSELRHDAYVSLTGWLQPIAIWHLTAEGGMKDAGLDAKPPFDLSRYVAERRFARARDGTRIPYTIVARRGWRANAANPVLATAYGAYQYSWSPRFEPRLPAFLDAGGIFVVANVRGGGEYGREWHKAGQKATKPNTWLDFIDVSKALIASRVTSSTRLVIQGTSAGGITVGRALTERPDLFAGAVADVGWMNPLRYVAEQNNVDIEEWGPVVDAASFRVLYDMDSYHAIRDGVRYPAVLITCGINDPRVATFNAAKFGARLQAATASPAPILLRVDFDAGHGVGSTRTQRDALLADIYTFTLWRAGARGFQVSASAA
jgi:prolyl oligopeptidase